MMLKLQNRLGDKVFEQHFQAPSNKALQATPMNVAKIPADFIRVPRSKRGALVVGRA